MNGYIFQDNQIYRQQCDTQCSWSSYYKGICLHQFYYIEILYFKEKVEVI